MTQQPKENNVTAEPEDPRDVIARAFYDMETAGFPPVDGDTLADLVARELDGTVDDE